MADLTLEVRLWVYYAEALTVLRKWEIAARGVTLTMSTLSNRTINGRGVGLGTFFGFKLPLQLMCFWTGLGLGCGFGVGWGFGGAPTFSPCDVKFTASL